MAAFRGNHPAKVDDKGRLKLPAAFKQLLDAETVKQFYITSADGKSAEIWPLPEWEKREALLAESSTMDPAVKRYMNLTSYYGHQVEADQQGRVLLPQILRAKAGLDKDVDATVMGMGGYIEVHNREQFERQMEELTPENMQTLTDLLRRK